MRRKIADWSSGLLAVAILALGGLVVVKPAVDNWDSLYRGDPFQAQAGVKTVEAGTAGKLARTTTTATETSTLERMLGDSGLLLLRICLVAFAAFLAAGVLQRAILGNYGLRSGPAGTTTAPAGVLDRLPGRARPASEEPTATAPAARNGPGTVPDAGAGNLAPSIARLVASQREELGLSQRELAKRAGISHTVVSRIEQGQHTPSRKTLERLTDALRAAR